MPELTAEQLRERDRFEHELLDTRQAWCRALREGSRPKTSPKRRAELEAHRRQLMERARKLALEIAVRPALNWTQTSNVFEI